MNEDATMSTTGSEHLLVMTSQSFEGKNRVEGVMIFYMKKSILFRKEKKEKPSLV